MPGVPPLAGLEGVPDLVFRFRLTPTPGFEYVSESATAIIGYTPEEHYADPGLAERLVHPDDAVLLREADERRLYRVRWRHRNGSEVVLEERVQRIYGEAGDVVAIVGVCRPAGLADAWTAIRGDVRVDLAGVRASVAGRELTLTPSEHRILACLAASDRAVGRRELVRRLWGSYDVQGERALEVHVANLRRKLEEDPRRPRRLVTVRGVGYRLL